MIDPITKDVYAKRVGSLRSDCSVLTASILSDINQVFYGEGPEGNLSATNLSIRYVTGQEYHDLVTGVSGQFEPKTLYVISSDEINAYNTRIKNVADPVENYDAANKRWVDQYIDSKLDKCSNSSILCSNAMLAFGTGTNVANGNQSIAIGNNVSAMSGKSLAIGQSNEVNSPYSLAFGENSYTSGNGKAFAIGNAAAATEAFSYAFGKNVEANGQYSRVIGLSSKANGNYSVTIGKNNTISSLENNSDGIFVGGINNTANVKKNGPSFIYGRSNTLTNAGLNFIAGDRLSSSHNWSMMLGGYAKSTNDNQFIWSHGDSSSPYQPKNEQGTFNIDPTNGISGFYIKDKSLAELLSSKVDSSQLSDIYNSIKIGYVSSYNAIYLSSESYITSVDCTDFIKDKMLSTVELCGTCLVFTFNDDAEKQPISVEMSSFADNYDDKILNLSTAIDKKTYVDGLSTESLSVVHISQEEFYQKVVASALLSNELYVVSGNYINAYGQQLKNLAYPKDLSDAITIEYLHNQGYEDGLSALSGWISRNFEPFADDSSSNVISIKKSNGLSANAVTIGIRNPLAPIADGSLANGDKCVALSAYSHAEGSNTFATGTASHAEGGGTNASNLASHAEGAYTIASGIAAHAEGLGLSAGPGLEFGKADGAVSHTDGVASIATGTGSYVGGIKALDNGYAHSFVWQGYGGETLTSSDIKVLTDREHHEAEFPTVVTKAMMILGSISPYPSNGPGTFNINPAGGTNGFFIGQTSLSSIISNAIQPLAQKITELQLSVNTLSTQLNGANQLIDQILQDQGS